ncbi:hypothetical protein IGK47_004628 [Enterococcus sp. AZ007]
MIEFLFQFIDGLIGWGWELFVQLVEMISDIINYLLSAQL